MCLCGQLSLYIAPRLQRRRCSVRGPIAAASPAAALAGYTQSQPVRVRGVPDLCRPTQGRYERRWAGVDMAMQRIWALHSRAYPYVFHMCKELTTVSARARMCGVLVPSIGGKACGVADGTRARRLDVLVHGRDAQL
jgi:hypothetical protein